MKRNGILLLLGGMLAWQPLGAQQTVTFAASEYAPLYNGQVEMPYTRSQYFNTPYYAGEICGGHAGLGHRGSIC